MPVALPALLLAVTHAAAAQGAITACASVSTTEIAALLKRDPGTIRMTESTPAQGHLQCDWKAMERVVGAEDAMAGELSLDIYRFADAAHAAARLKGIGSPAMALKTSSPAGTDDVVQLGEQVRTENVNREPGYAARHGEFLVIAQMSGTFMQERAGDWPLRMQTLALKSAGATVTGPLYPYACQVIPIGQLQTLLTLAPATMVTDADYASSLEKCGYEATDKGQRVGSITLSIQHLVTADARAGREASAGSRGTLVTTADASDRVYVKPGDRGDVTAFHGDTEAHLNVIDPDVHVLVDRSFPYRLQRAALQAAGATVVPATNYGPDPVAQAEQPAAPPNAAAKLKSYFTLPTLVLVVFVLVLLNMARNAMQRRRIRATGLPGMARIDAVRDTGATINNSPLVHFDVTLQPQTGAPYQASTRSTVSRLAAQASLVGQTLPVNIDPRDPQRFVFVQSL